jgi:pimeloyl-ACP methyl ester carboxylesterase
MRRRAVVGVGILAALCLLGFVISAAFGGSTPPGPTTTTTQTTVTTSSTKQLEVGTRTLSFSDPSRKTTSFTTGKTALGRTVGVELDYPTYLGSPNTETPNVAIASRKSYPLIVFAPGYRLRPSNYATLIASWVKAGFLVAALEFPDTTYPSTVAPYNAHLPYGSPETDMYNEPGDVAFAIRQLSTAATTKSNWLDGLVKKDAIVLAGHSDGGDVVAALVFDAAARITGVSVRGVAVLSGAEFPVANQTYSQPTGPAVPLLVVQSMTDVCNRPSSAVQLYNAIGAPKYYLDLDNATHLGAYDGADAPAAAVVARTTIAFFEGALGTAAISTPALSAQATRPGVSSLLTSSLLPPIAATSSTTTCPTDPGAL